MSVAIIATIALDFACTSIILSLPDKIGQMASPIATVHVYERKHCVSLHPRRHMFQPLVECTASQALSTYHHLFHASVILQLLQLHQQKTPLQWLSSEVTVMSKAAVSLTPQVDTRVSASQGSELSIASSLIK